MQQAHIITEDITPRARLLGELEKRAIRKTTREVYARQMTQFERWKEECAPTSADEDAAINYLSRRCEGWEVVGDDELKPFSPAMLATALAAFSDAGLERPPSRAVRGLRNIIRERSKGEVSPQRARAILADEVLDMMMEFATGKSNTRAEQMLAARNAAMILLGWCAMLRPSELLSLDINDIEITPNTLAVRLCERKNLRAGEKFRIGLAAPVAELKPVFDALRRVVLAWMEIRSELPGEALFCVLRSDMLGKRISKLAIVDRMIKKASRFPLSSSGHSLRRGGVQARVMAGQAAAEVMHIGGWADLRAFSSYIGGVR